MKTVVIALLLAVLAVPVFAEDAITGFAGAGATFNPDARPNAGFVLMGQVNLVDGFGIFADYARQDVRVDYTERIGNDVFARHYIDPVSTIHIGPSFRVFGNQSTSVWGLIGIGAYIGDRDKVLTAEFGGYAKQRIYKKVSALVGVTAESNDKSTSPVIRLTINYDF